MSDKKIGMALSAAVGTVLGSAMLLSVSTNLAFSEADNDNLIIDGVAIATQAPAPEDSELEMLYSGWRFRSDETQALQTDDFENPAFIAVEQAEEQFTIAEGTAGKSCSDCHADVAEFKGVRAQLPRWDEAKGKPETLEHIINDCRTERMGAKPWKWEASQMVNMTALIGLQSRGMPVAVKSDGPMQSVWEKGKELYYTRVGQLDMSCANCHENNYGNMIRADHLSQGQINGFPVYRLKWAGMGSIHRRFKGCMENIRATPYKRGSDEFVALETYLATRGNGLSVETPSVRN
ncbi:MAG: sulfur oxidation c-type cytochrome SoxA [Nitratireductor sp.]